MKTITVHAKITFDAVKIRGCKAAWIATAGKVATEILSSIAAEVGARRGLELKVATPQFMSTFGSGGRTVFFDGLGFCVADEVATSAEREAAGTGGNMRRLIGAVKSGLAKEFRPVVVAGGLFDAEMARVFPMVVSGGFKDVPLPDKSVFSPATGTVPVVADPRLSAVAAKLIGGNNDELAVLSLAALIDGMNCEGLTFADLSRAVRSASHAL